MLRQFLVAILLTILIACGQNNPLIDYEPESPQEKAIKSVLLDFQNGVNTKDYKKIENIIHEKASIMIGKDRRILSQKEYIKILPERLATNPSIGLGTPKMKVSSDKAQVKIYMTRGDNTFLIIFNMKLENNKWFIHSWEY